MRRMEIETSRVAASCALQQGHLAQNWSDWILVKIQPDSDFENRTRPRARITFRLPPGDYSLHTGPTLQCF